MVEESVPNSQRIFFNEQFSVVANDQKNDKTKSTIVGFRCLLRPFLSFNAACSPQIDAFLESNPQALFEIWGCLGVTSFQLSFVVVVFCVGSKHCRSNDCTGNAEQVEIAKMTHFHWLTLPHHKNFGTFGNG